MSRRAQSRIEEPTSGLPTAPRDKGHIELVTTCPDCHRAVGAMPVDAVVCPRTRRGKR